MSGRNISTQKQTTAKLNANQTEGESSEEALKKALRDLEAKNKQLQREKEAWQQNEQGYQAQILAMQQFIRESQLEMSFATFMHAQSDTSLRHSDMSSFTQMFQQFAGSGNSKAELPAELNRNSSNLMPDLQRSADPVSSAKHGMTKPLELDESSISMQFEMNHHLHQNFRTSESRAHESPDAESPGHAGPKESIISLTSLIKSFAHKNLGMNRNSGLGPQPSQRSLHQSVASPVQYAEHQIKAIQMVKSLYGSNKQAGKTTTQRVLRTERPVQDSSEYLNYLKVADNQQLILRPPAENRPLRDFLHDQAATRTPGRTQPMSFVGKHPTPMAKKPYESRPASKMSILSGRGPRIIESQQMTNRKIKQGSRNEQGLKQSETHQQIHVDSEFLEFYGVKTSPRPGGKFAPVHGHQKSMDVPNLVEKRFISDNPARFASQTPDLSVGDRDQSPIDSNDEKYSGNDKQSAVLEEEGNTASQRHSMKSSAVVLQLMNRNKSNSVFKQGSRLLQTPAHPPRSRIVAITDDLDFKPPHVGELTEAKAQIKEVMDESNKTGGSSLSSNEHMNTQMPNETKKSSSTFGGQVSQFPILRPSPSRFSKRQLHATPSTFRLQINQAAASSRTQLRSPTRVNSFATPQQKRKHDLKPDCSNQDLNKPQQQMKAYSPFVQSKQHVLVDKTLKIKAKEQSTPTRQKEADETILPGTRINFEIFQENFQHAVKMVKEHFQKQDEDSAFSEAQNEEAKDQPESFPETMSKFDPKRLFEDSSRVTLVKKDQEAKNDWLQLPSQIIDGDENVRESTIQIGQSDSKSYARFSTQQNVECIQVKHRSLLKSEMSEEPKQTENNEESLSSSLERDSQASLQNSSQCIMESLFLNNLKKITSYENKDKRESDVESRESADNMLSEQDLLRPGGVAMAKSVVVEHAGDRGKQTPAFLYSGIEESSVVLFNALGTAADAPLDRLGPHAEGPNSSGQEEPQSARFRGLTVAIQKSRDSEPHGLFAAIEGDKISYSRSLRQNTIRMNRGRGARMLNYNDQEKDTMLKSLVGFPINKPHSNNKFGSSLENQVDYFRTFKMKNQVMAGAEHLLPPSRFDQTPPRSVAHQDPRNETVQTGMFAGEHKGITPTQNRDSHTQDLTHEDREEYFHLRASGISIETGINFDQGHASRARASQVSMRSINDDENVPINIIHLNTHESGQHDANASPETGKSFSSEMLDQLKATRGAQFQSQRKRIESPVMRSQGPDTASQATIKRFISNQNEGKESKVPTVLIETFGNEEINNALQASGVDELQQTDEDSQDLNEGDAANHVSIIRHSDRTKIPSIIVVPRDPSAETVRAKINQTFFQFVTPKSKGTRLFELFQVVGINEEDLEHGDFTGQVSNFESPGIFGEKLRRKPRSLYQYPETPETHQVLSRSKVLKDFAFPNGVQCKQITDVGSQEAVDLLRNMLLEGQNNRPNAFIFTLDANGDAADASEVSNFFHCLCIKFKTIKQRKSDNSFFLVEQTFCLLSKNTYFSVLFELLDSLLLVINSSQRLIHFQKLASDPDASSIESGLAYAQSLMQVDLCAPHNYDSVVEVYHQQLCRSSSDYPLEAELLIDIRLPALPGFEEASKPFNFRFPRSFRDCHFFSFNWNVPVLLSLFKDFKMLMKVVTSIMLERSVIFVSKSPSKLSSVILGLIELISPFHWCHTLIPVLPGELFEILDAPVPLLVGLTQQSFDMLDFDIEFKDTKTWIYLDSQITPPRFSTPEVLMTGIDWCRNEEALSYEDQLWFIEYPGLSNIISLHEKFNHRSTSIFDCKCIDTSLEDNAIFHFSEKQMKILAQFRTEYITMMVSQILSHIDLLNLHLQHLQLQADKSMSTNQIISHLQNEVLDKCLFNSVDMKSIQQQSYTMIESQYNSSFAVGHEPNRSRSQNLFDDLQPFLSQLIVTQSFVQLLDKKVISVN